MLVSVSTMPAGDNIKEYLQEIKNYADFLHCDICDGKYNSTVCFSPDMAKEINNISTIPIDVHLMTKDIIKNTKKYIKAGANIVTAQVESFDKENDVTDFIELVKSSKTLVGLSLEPQTKTEAIRPFISSLDVVLVMAVKTGSSGQKFDNSVIDKIEQLNQLKSQYGYNFKIQVDGGIDNAIAKLLKTKGVDIVVSGSFVYNSTDKAKTINSLK